MKITILGCASSLGTPSAGGFWGRCDPAEPRNHRSRASILVQSETTDILVDATPDVRWQLNAHPVKKLDGLLLSHHHSDHINGIDDLRALAYHNNAPIEVYGNAETMDKLAHRNPYLFNEDKNGIYTIFLRRNVIENYQKFTIGDIAVESFEQDHTSCATLGFRFNNFAYSVDIADMPEKSLEALKGVDTWVVDCGSYRRASHEITTHANLERVTAWVERLKPKMTYLTVLSTHMDYRTLCDELPPYIRPAWDGMVIDTAGN